jgi:hypothetical protein
MFIWRALTGCKPQWDPTRYPRVRMGRIFSLLNFGLLLAVSGFQLWFWIVGINTLSVGDCPDFGFLLFKFDFDARGFVVANIVIHALLLACCLGAVGLMVVRLFGISHEHSEKKIK